MKAIAVLPGKPGSVHLAELAKPSVSDVPNGRGVLVKVLRVGVDGTDREINAAEYGTAPEGYDFLVIGHEGFGQVEAIGPNVSFLRPGDFVVATVRRPGKSLYDAIGLQDMTTDDQYFERGINLRHGYLTEYYIEDEDFVVKIPQGLREVGVLLEFVLGNKVMVGSVNASRDNFETGVRDMSQAEAEYPGWLRQLLTHPVQGLDGYRELFDRLQNPNGAIKIFCELG
jgi:threonine dehydrogenase-like Zn-dependent dehydrogenase